MATKLALNIHLKTAFMRKIAIAILFILPCIFAQAQNKMTAHFIDVGQGEATLLEFPCGAILIDAGGENNESDARLIDYLNAFFEKRRDLNNTLDLVVISHAHYDHNRALDDLAEHFTIKRYVDNGIRREKSKGEKQQTSFRKALTQNEIEYATFTTQQILLNGNQEGVSNEIIDPIDCPEVDPQVILLSGRYPRKPASWSEEDYANPNNHSVVVKVIFGESSFLFTGDLEKAGIGFLLEKYPSEMLDVDFLKVGHHGSHNATTREFLEAVTPSHAFISCGKWNTGGANGYGHPKKSVLDLLEEFIENDRSTPVQVKAGLRARRFTDYSVTKKIYATAWDNTIQLDLDADGSSRVTTDQ